MRKWFAGLTILFMVSNNLSAQKAAPMTEAQVVQVRAVEDTLMVLAYAVLNDSLAENRFAACRDMIPNLVKALKVENSFSYPFKRLPSVSIQYPQDSSFRVFTWQLYVDENDYRYYGAIQMNSGLLRLFPLVDRSFQTDLENIEYETFPADKWYGAVYYNLRQVEGPQGSYYLLFGFDGNEFFRKRKVVDVLAFGADGKPSFGAPVFVQLENGRPVETKKRLFLEYSSGATVRLNYDELLEMIIFDHLIEMGGQYGEGMVYVPDGSYEGYRLEGGRWVYIPKIWDQVQDEPIRPMPILDGKKKNIIGQ